MKINSSNTLILFEDIWRNFIFELDTMKHYIFILFFLTAFNFTNVYSQCNTISNLSFTAVNINSCDFPRIFEFNSIVDLDSTPLFISTQTSLANFLLPFDLNFPTNNNNCKYRLDIIGSYTAWGNNERYDAYCKFNNNNGALISVGGGMGDDLSPAPIESPTAYDTSHSYSYYFIGNGNDVKYKFRDNNYSDNDGTANFNWYAIPCFNYEWDFGDGNISNSKNPSHVYDIPGIYTVTLKIKDLLNNCYESFETSIIVYPKAEVNLGGTTVICPPSTLQLFPGNFQSYLWQNGSTNNSFLVNTPGLYWVEVTDALGCTASSSVEIEESCKGEVLVPNAFTPNDDGLNDVFKAVSIRTKLTYFKMFIFNRKGMLLFETDDINQGWNGTFEGSKVANGTYAFKLSYGGIIGNETFNKKEAGTFVVVR